jgi:predicted amidohydrolase
MLRIAVCQLPLDIENFEENITMANAAIHDASSKGAELVVLPELTNSGYVFRTLAELEERATTLDGAIIKEWISLAEKLNLVLVAGLAIKDEGQFFNVSVIIDPSGLRGWYKKVHLWNDEVDFFTPGDTEPLVVDTVVGRIATMVCYDVEFPEWVRLTMLSDATILALPTNWPDGGLPTEPTPLEAVRVQAAASTNKIIIAAADRTRVERGVAWSSASIIADSDGVIRAMADRSKINQQQILVADIEVPTDRKISPRNDVRIDRRPDLYKGVLRR